MDRKTFETLINREIDGLLTPEEAAQLNDWTARNPEAAAQQEALHRIHRAFREMERPQVPEGLAEQIADQVLARPARVHHVSWWRRPRVLGRIAAALLVVVAASFAGQQLTGDKVAEAKPDAQRQQHIEHWVEWGLDRESADRVADVCMRFPDIKSVDAEDRYTGLVLKILKDAGQLPRYLEERGLTLEKAERLIEHAGK